MSQQSKVVSLKQLVTLLTERRSRGQRFVFTNGCFDLLHVGHTRYLQEARALGDVLVVGVNADVSVRALNKGADRPIVPEAQRAEVLAALACVDFVTLFEEPDPQRMIELVQPDVLALSRYRWRCLACGKEFSRTRRTIRPSRHRCGVCRGPLEEVMRSGESLAEPRLTAGTHPSL